MPTNTSNPASCKIQVRATELNSTLGYSHLYLVYTDAEGKEHYARGGPSAGGPGSSSGVSGQLSGGSSHNSSANGSNSSTSGGSASGSNPSTSGKRGGPYGHIVTESGLYEEGTIDWDPNAKSVDVLTGADACKKWEEIEKQMIAINDSKTAYSPLGPNSNSTVYTALKNVGIKPAVPSGVWAPGKDVSIKVATPKQSLSSATMACPAKKG